MKKAVIYLILFLLIMLLPALCLAEEAAGNIGAVLPLWTILPFAGILLSIALMPLFLPHFWHRHFPKVSALSCCSGLYLPFRAAFILKDR